MKTLLLKSENLILLILLLIVSSVSRGQTQTYTSSGTFTPPAGVTSVKVEAYGAGGGGGYGGTSNKKGGGGGGGGGYTVGNSVTVTPGTSHAITIGSAGTGSTASGTNGANGGQTSGTFTSTTITADGGLGGRTYANGGNGGNGGSGGGGTTTRSGGTGGSGSTTGSGGGGGAAGTTSGGGNGSIPTGGTAGGGSASAGGAGSTSNTAPGSNAVAYGGGGGGGTKNSNGGNGAAGYMVITYTCPTYALTSTASPNLCGAGTAVVTLTGSAVGLPVGNYTVTYNLSGATTATGSTASMTVSVAGTGTFTTSSLNVGNNTVTVTNLASSYCSNSISSNNTDAITVVAPATASAGSAINTCSTTGAVNITTGSTASNYSSVAWTTSGTGTLTNATSLTTCTYTPSAAENAAGSTITLTLTAYGNSPCGNVTSNKNLIISKAMTVAAGSNMTTCAGAGAVNVSSGASATNQTGVVWTSSGSGTFVNPNSLGACSYTPSAADIAAGSVTITLTVSNNGCSNISASKTITIIPAATSVAGTTINTCATTGAVNITAGSSATNYTSVTWSGGTGTFANANSLTTCTYTPSAAENLAGSTITLTLTAVGNSPCGSVTSTKSLIISKAMTAIAGTNITTCSSAGAVNITAGSSATNQTLVTWSSSGTGTFANANSLTTCTYTPSAADISAGSVTLTLTASNAGCANVTSNKTLTIVAAATSVAGTNVNTCQTSGAVNITAGASATNYTSVTWTASGIGTFTNANSLTTCTYTPSIADIALGSVTLTLTVNGNSPCGSVTSTKTLIINKTMTAIAGTNVTTCANSGAVNITAGSSALFQTSVTWSSSGTGTFANANSLTTCTYTPSAADISAGSVTLTLTASNGGCANATSTKTLTINPAPAPIAGPALSTCSDIGSINITGGSSAANSTSITWTSSGTGTFANPNSLTTCTYTQSTADITAGSVTLTLTASSTGCNNVTSTKVLTILAPPTSNAGTAIFMCNASGPYNITAGASATNYSSVTWTSSGTGTFANANSLTTCTYSPSAADILAGSVNITLTANGNSPCANVTSTKLVTITSPTAVAGTNVSTCATAGAVNITAGASGTNYTSLVWSSSGTGTFANATSLTTCTYTPSAADITAGTVTITLTVSAPGCSNDTSSKTLTIYAAPTITGTTPGSRSGAGTVILGATASVGTVYWYTASTGGSSIGFGTNFTTPSISATTTYYVEAVNGSCTSSPRVAVVATVNYPEIDVQGNATSIVDGDTTPSTTDWTDFGAVTSTRTFTIKNTGVGVLTIGAITISGANASDFTVTTLPSSSVASGSSTTFVVTFNPSAAGTRTASISMVNSDSDENPYDFSIQGTGVAREIDIKGNGTTIVDGDTTPSTADWTDFSTVASTRTFTIYNTGNVVLTLSTPTITGTNASDFAITTPPATTIGAYGSTTFTVTFTPSAINNRTATINIVNDDSDENPYDFAIQGFGIIPEIDVQGNATSIVDGDTTPTTADWTDFSNTVATRTFTIYNQGNTTLTVGTVTVTGSDFTVTTQPSSTVAAFSSTTFTVTFNPTTTGVKTSTLSFSNNDSNENPYDFKIQGTAIAQEIDLQGNATSIVDGDTTPSTTDWTDFSNVTSTRTFTIFNQGNIPLTIGAITFTGTNAADFSVTTSPSATVAAFSSTTFVVTFNSGGTGTRTATMNIANNDSNENPYDVAIQATGGTRVITVSNQNAVSIPDGDVTPTAIKQTDFGSVSTASGSVTVTYTIKNTGTAAVSIGAASFTGTNAADFSMTLAPASALAPGATSNFEISFNPTTQGTKTATFSIVTNATGMNPFDFALTGTGVQTYADTDGDGITDNMDLDDDNDGIKDVKEQSDAIAYPLNNMVQYTFLNETFGTGRTKGKININTPGASTTSCYEDNITSNANSCATNSSGVLDDGEYVVNYIITNSNGVSSDPENIHHDLAWTDQLDHTPGDTDGRMAIFNADNTAGTYFYQLIINGVLPNTVTSFNFWVMNLMRQGNLGSTILPNITVEFRDVTGATLIASYNTGDIGRCSASNSLDNTCGPSLSNWLNYSTSVNLGNVTDFMIKIRNNAPGGGGNDFAMDDIVITQNYVDSDGDGIANIFDLDDENDGIPDIEEAGLKAYSNGLSKMDLTSPSWVDTNGNGLNDNVESLVAGSGTYILDTDGDGVPNYLDLDSDNDSFFDVDEANLLNGDGDINGDGKGDLSDTDRDGILDLYDNNTGFGTTTRAYAQDTDSDGIPDYLEVDANNDGIKDITTGLYGSLDANGDGKIDGSTDADKDGILDSFDTNTLVIGSPRDLNRKLQLDFDGRNDYAEATGVLGGLANATLMAWIDLNSAWSTAGVVVGQDKFQIRITSNRKIEVVVNGTILFYNPSAMLNTSQWYHVAATYGGGNINLYLNGKLVATQALTGNIAADATKLTLGRNPLVSTAPASTPYYFKGKIDEVRVFNAALTAAQVQRMVYQEIQNTSSQVRGAIVPKDVGSLPFANVLRYYRMDAYKDDIVDDLTTASIDSGTGMKMYNHKNIYVQEAPMPFTTVRTGTFATAINDATKDIRGLDVNDYDYSIVQVKHDVTETANTTNLALFIDPSKTVSMTNNTKLQNDWYLKLDGKIDLVGKSQLVQTTNSDLDVTSAGSLERDQQGQSNKYNYNYWSSPVSSINNTTINHGFTVAGVMKDGTDPNNIQNIQWTTGINATPTTPITLSSYWIFKFQNSSNSYANWSSVGQNGALLPGQGFTLKGSGAATADQNYTFVGKPNNGTITSTVGPNNLNLCGNPYPSAIDADKFIDDNATSLTGTLYIWQHYSTNTSHTTIQYQGGYATYTKTGGTAPVAPAGVSGLGSSSKTPKRFIPVGQGFFVTGSATGGTITFNNAQRLFIKEDDATNSYTMFKSTNPTVESNPAMNNAEDSFVEEQFMKLRLGYNSTDNLHRQTLLGFMNQHATSGYDNGYDGISLEALSNDMYFINGSYKLNIDGDGYFNANNIYPLGVKNATSGNVTFVVDGKENFDPNQEIYIYDNVTNTYNSIKSQSYQVNLPAGTYENRFSLTFKNTSALGTDENEETSHGIVLTHTQSDNMINIKNELQEVSVKSVMLFNLLGQNVNSWQIDDQNQAEIHLPVSGLATGTYIVKVVTDNGEITKKILIK
ncbi:MAG TPA: choice-of-anchor D domain-containing protein [Flavobacterium sp.]|uniref:choice-of-anchor D domain-containing protein n=1 Tax=Flavobacterium sp. TaxID=239 RepID=UPI002C6E6E27|nr:choice-of-anchor D domain-containing protein [Flavobacterium sp.]HNP32261.1 choice-of-anchor D domain-containing protein [Flavobacterium sp.]